MKIARVCYDTTPNDEDLPPDEAKVDLDENVTVTVYVHQGKTLIVEIDVDADEPTMVPFKVYRNDGLLWQEEPRKPEPEPYDPHGGQKHRDYEEN